MVSAEVERLRCPDAVHTRDIGWSMSVGKRTLLSRCPLLVARSSKEEYMQKRSHTSEEHTYRGDLMALRRLQAGVISDYNVALRMKRNCGLWTCPWHAREREEARFSSMKIMIPVGALCAFKLVPLHKVRATCACAAD